MSKTTIDKARREARNIAARDGITYQQALDAVARDHGHPHWAAFKTNPADVALINLDALLSHARRRRSSALRFNINKQGFYATVINRNNNGICASGNAMQMDQLCRAALVRFGIDILGPEEEKQMSISVDGEQIEVTVNNYRDGDEHRLVVYIQDAVLGSASLEELGIFSLPRWLEMLMQPDHGLVLVVGKTGSGRSTTIDRSVKWANDVGVVAYGFGERFADEAIERSHSRIALLEVQGEVIDEILAEWSERHPGVRLLGGIEQRIVLDGDASVLESRVVDRERSQRRVAEMTASNRALAEEMAEALRNIGGPKLEEAFAQAIQPYADKLIAEAPALQARTREITHQLRRA